jgi:hypothetical protein
MTHDEIEQVVLMLANLGFKVEWVDPNGESFLVRVQPARSV